jgi:SPP1 family predicted phage head-tail adaptor
MGIDCTFNKTMTITHLAVSQDAIGGEVYTSDSTATAKCRIRQLSKDENTSQGRETIDSTHRIYCDASVDVEENDVIAIGTDTFDVRGVDDPHRLGEFLQIDVELRTTNSYA